MLPPRARPTLVETNSEPPTRNSTSLRLSRDSAILALRRGAWASPEPPESTEGRRSGRRSCCLNRHYHRPACALTGLCHVVRRNPCKTSYYGRHGAARLLPAIAWRKPNETTKIG